MRKYFKVWWIFAANSVQSQITLRWGLVFLLFGKLLRFATYIIFINVLVSKTKALAGYSLDETLLFFLTFNLIDILGQLFYRDVYRFRPAVVQGTFDFYLIKPINSLFRSLSSGPDLLDFITLIPLIGGLVFIVNRLHITDITAIFLYILLGFCAFIITTSFYILVLCLGVLTTEIDHAIMVYRDISAMGRFPIDIYVGPLKSLLTFIVPVGLMMSFPVKAILGELSYIMVVYSLIFSVGFFYFSIKMWNWSLKYYSSASS